LPEETGGDALLSIDEISDKVNGLAKGRVPLKSDRMSMFIDVVRQEVA